jgi:hypothetical protein
LGSWLPLGELVTQAGGIPSYGSPDTFHLQAAQGWLELGSHIEVNEDLEKMAPGFQTHPEVLEIRW